MIPVVKAADAAQFLSFVPALLGFTPRRSLVVVPFGGSRSLGAMRFDLPSDDNPAAAATIVGLVCRVPEANAMTVVVYTEEAASEMLPHSRFLSELISRADACGLRVVDALCVAPAGWGCYLESRADLRPLVQLTPPAHPDLPAAVGDQESGTRLPKVSRAARTHVAQALTELDAAVAELCGPDPAGRQVSAPSDERRVSPLALAAALELDDLPAFFERVLDDRSGDVDAYDAALLTWCFERPSIRDVALVQWAAGAMAGDDALEAQLRWEAGEEYPEDLARIMWGDGERPDIARLTGALEVVRTVVALAPRTLRAGGFAAAAWLSWALGRSTHADRYAFCASEIDPDHGLAGIVQSFVAAGHLPDWAFRGGSHR